MGKILYLIKEKRSVVKKMKIGREIHELKRPAT